jgi:hypothetical protein
MIEHFENLEVCAQWFDPLRNLQYWKNETNGNIEEEQRKRGMIINDLISLARSESFSKKSVNWHASRGILDSSWKVM